MIAAELLNGVYRAAGDPLEERIPPGLVEQATDTALRALSQLAVEQRPDAMRGHRWARLAADQDVFDIPREIKALEHLSLVRAPGEKEQELFKVAPASFVAAEVVGPVYGWHYESPRRVRVIRPDRSIACTPGVRCMGVLELRLPIHRDIDIEELDRIDGALSFIKARAARELRNAPGAQVDPEQLRKDFVEAREEVIRALAFFDAAANPPLPEAQTLF